MRSSVNLVIQVLVVLGCVLLRLTCPGWLLVVFFVFVPFGSGLLGIQLVLAACATFRPRLPAPAVISFLVTAGCCLGTSLLVEDGGDTRESEHRPVDVLFGTHVGDGADSLAVVLGLGWVVALLATLVVLCTATIRPAAPTGGF